MMSCLFTTDTTDYRTDGHRFRQSENVHRGFATSLIAVAGSRLRKGKRRRLRLCARKKGERQTANGERPAQAFRMEK
jgi:hypothetical protein